MANILIIEDEPVLAQQLASALHSGGHEVHVAGSATAGLEAALATRPDLVLLDLRLPDRSGLEVITDLKGQDANVLVVLMTAYGSVRDAVEAMRRGAADYLNKPLDAGELGLLITRLLQHQRRERELDYLRSRNTDLPDGALGDDPRLQQVFEQVQRLCDPDLPAGRRPSVLLFGEPGTGKGLVARALHASLGGGPFIEVSCAGVSSAKLETELFGRERGEDGASQPGLLEAGDGGTVFLDEIGSLPLELQEHFLQLIDHRNVRRLGSSRDREVSVHVIASTHEDLEAAARDGHFSEKLLDRLAVLRFEIPPLRERPADLRGIAKHLAAEIGKRRGGIPRSLSEEAEVELAAHPWPGNVRELRNAIERAVLVSPDAVLSAAVFANVLDQSVRAAAAGRILLPAEGLRLEEVERDLLKQALERARGNRTRASALLGLTRDTFRYRLAKWGLDIDGGAV